MKCDYCLQELNDGATVCHSCGRTQRRVHASRWRFGLAIAAALTLAGVVGYFIEDNIARDHAIDGIVLCQGFKFGTPVNRADVEKEMSGLEGSGTSWREAADTLREISGCGPAPND